MPYNTSGLHHFHKRVRIHEKHEKYPHPDKRKNLMDRLIYFIAILGPVVTLPQFTKVWIDKSAIGVSFITWGSYAVISLFWLIYGLLHKERPIILSSSANLVMQLSVAIGTLIYG
jgi:uncharacterized protein with PQ loop repeat